MIFFYIVNRFTYTDSIVEFRGNETEAKKASYNYKEYYVTCFRCDFTTFDFITRKKFLSNIHKFDTIELFFNPNETA